MIFLISFVILTYNHEKYIIEHLESIKYQIQNYGKGQKIELIVSDDLSSDKTIYLIEQWLQRNSLLFDNVKININEKRLGIVKNYLKASSLINGNKFKLLAGDDLYASKNIIEIINEIESYDVIFSPILYLNNNQIYEETDIRFKLAYKYQNNIKKLKDMFKFGCFFKAPGAFINKKIFKDSSYISFISKYEYIEDYSTWYYLFFKLNDLNIKILNEPYILYRMNVGVSTNSNNEFSNRFKAEEKILKEEFGCKLKENNFNIYKNIMRVYKIRYYIYDKVFDEKIKEFEYNQQKSISEQESYLNLIMNNKYKFLKEIEFNY